ncbi:MAG: hypothetical protein LBI44_07850 [Oscillospiraceae bacterium]|jgi:hypothetical protein|nr:hypothetical protein [Oscillospiraceae bacterium]
MLEEIKKNIAITEKQLLIPFDREDELNQKEARLAELNAKLNLDKKDEAPVLDENEEKKEKEAETENEPENGEEQEDESAYER